MKYMEAYYNQHVIVLLLFIMVSWTGTLLDIASEVLTELRQLYALDAGPLAMPRALSLCLLLELSQLEGHPLICTCTTSVGSPLEVGSMLSPMLPTGSAAEAQAGLGGKRV